MAESRPRPRPGDGSGRATTTRPRAGRGSATPALSPEQLSTATVEPDTDQPTVSRRRVPRHKRAARSLRRAFRGPRGKWMIVGIVGALVLIVGLLVNGFLSSPAPPVDQARAGDVNGGGLDFNGPSASASKGAGTDKNGKKGPASPQDIKNLLNDKLAQNPLNNLRAPGLHDVTISARSSGPLKIIGYLVPTGQSHVYGAPRTNSSSYSLSQQAYGKGYLAAVFVQAGRSRAPITCSVTVDGKTTNSETTSGQYGRAVCLG